MTGANCRDIRAALGVYVLGAIEPAERAQVDSHLATCPDCREELAGLAGLPALLHRVPFDEARRLAHEGLDGAGGLDPAASLLPGLLARAAGVRRARRWRSLSVAAAVLVVAVGAGVAAGSLGGQAAPPTAGHTVSPTAQPSGSPAAGSWHTVTGAGQGSAVRLTVRYAPMTWGTSMNVQVTGVTPGTVCRLQVIDAAGRRWTVGNWRVPPGEWSAWYPASSSLPYDQMRGFALVAGRTVLARAIIG